MPDTKMFTGKRVELSFGDIAVEDKVDILGRLDESEAVFVHAELVHDRTKVVREREQEITRIRALIEDLIRRLQEIPARQGRSLPPGISPAPSPTATPQPITEPSPTPTPAPSPSPAKY